MVRAKWKAVGLTLGMALGATAAGPLAASGMAAGKPTLSVAIFNGPEANAVIFLGKLYEKKFGVHLNFVELPYTTLFSKELVSANSKTGTYDLFFMDDPWIPTFAGGGFLYPLSHFGFSPPSYFVKQALQVDLWPPPPGYNVPKGTITGPRQYYALPVTDNVLEFFYNKALAAKFGVNPEHWTWDEVNRVGAAARKEGLYGFVLRGNGGNGSVADFSPVLWSYGGHYFTASWHSDLDTPQAIAALKEWVHLFHLAPPGSASYGSTEVGTTMAHGKAAMALIWPSGWALQMPSSVGVAPVPGVVVNGKDRQVPEIGIWSLGVPKNAPHPEAAFQFMKWLTAPAQQMIYGRNGLNVPTATRALLDPAFDKKYPYYKVLYESLLIGRMRPRTPAWPYVEEALGQQIVAAELGKVTPAQAMKTAAQEIDQYMASHGLLK